MVTVGSGRIEYSDVYQLFVWFLAVGIMSYFMSIPEFRSDAFIYFVLGSFGLSVAILGFAWKRIGGSKVDDFDALIFEEPLIKSVSLRNIIFIALVASVTLFFIASTTEFRLSAPPFQVAEITAINSAFLSGLAGVIENLFFFSAVWSLLFYGIRLMIKRAGGGKQDLTSLLISGAVIPWIFLAYHNTAYGLDRPITSGFVILFGYIVVVTRILFGNFIVGDSLHFTNNFSIQLLKDVTPIVLLLAFIQSAVTYFLLAIAFAVMSSAQFKRGKGTLARLLAILAIISSLAALGILFG